jgi:hypothetical protein
LLKIQVARQFSTGTKFGSEKGKVQNPARIPPRDLAPRGREESRGGAIPFPQKNSFGKTEPKLVFRIFVKKCSNFVQYAPPVGKRKV